MTLYYWGTFTNTPVPDWQTTTLPLQSTNTFFFGPLPGPAPGPPLHPIERDRINLIRARGFFVTPYREGRATWSEPARLLVRKGPMARGRLGWVRRGGRRPLRASGRATQTSARFRLVRVAGGAP